MNRHDIYGGTDLLEAARNSVSVYFMQKSLSRLGEG